MVSIIIVNYNVEYFIKKCIESIKDTISSSKYEIIVVDNNSTDNSLQILKNNFKKITIIENENNLGFSKAVNIGIKNSSGKYIALINPDIFFVEDTLMILRKYLIENIDVGIVGCKVLNPDGTFQLSSRRSFPDIFSLFSKQVGLSMLFPNSKFFSKYNQTYISLDEIQKTDSISGACMMFKRNIIRRIGYFDERFFLYFEDTDYCLRAINAGYFVIYNPQTQIIHYKRKSSINNKTVSMHHFDESFIKFYKKYKEKYRYNFLTYLILKIIVIFRKNFRKVFSN